MITRDPGPSKEPISVLQKPALQTISAPKGKLQAQIKPYQALQWNFWTIGDHHHIFPAELLVGTVPHGVVVLAEAT